MTYAWSRTVAPVLEPLTLAEAKLQLRIDTTADDTAISRRISAARAQAEAYLMWGLLTQTWKYAQSDWADAIALPMAGQLQSVTSVKYYDTAGVQQTLATTYYEVDVLSEPGMVVRKPQQVWPSIQADKHLPIEIVYVVGYTTAAALPEDIVDAICLLLGDSHEQRQEIVLGQSVAKTHGVEAKLAPHRRWWRAPVCD